jgi:hypothetical protein
MITAWLSFMMKSPHYISEKKAAIVSWISAAVFTIGAMIFGLAMRRFIRPWTDEDEERLKALVGQGASIVRASAALRRRKVVVRERAKKLGCRFPTLAAGRKKWAGGPNNEWRD